MADFINAIRTTPTRDLRTTFEQVVARRAGVMRVRLRRVDAPGEAAGGASAIDSDATPEAVESDDGSREPRATGGAAGEPAAAGRTASEPAVGPAAASDPAAGEAATSERAASATTAATEPRGREAAAAAAEESAASEDAVGAGAAARAAAPTCLPPHAVTVVWRGVRYVLDPEPHTRDRGYVTGVLQSAAAVASIVLSAQGIEKETVIGPPVVQPVFDHDNRLYGSSPAMMRLRHEIEQSARTNFAVLIEGESGVGKELVARQIHASSARRRGPFVPVNCAAVVESLFESELFGIEEGVATGVRGRRGKFEQANGGTLFLDEIAELPLPAQAKLLRIVQDFVIERVGCQQARRVDVRLIVATNRSLCALVDQGQFRRDLYFRLRSLHIRVAPLRDRREDIAEIAEAYLRRCMPVRPPRLSRAAAGVLCLHHWPGNVRELERALEYALTRCGGQREILAEHLAPDLGQPYRDVLLQEDRREGPPDESLKSMKSRYARFKYDQYRGNKRKTCAALDISYHTLIALLERSANGAHRANGAHGAAGPPPQPADRLGVDRLGADAHGLEPP